MISDSDIRNRLQILRDIIKELESQEETISCEGKFCFFNA